MGLICGRVSVWEYSDSVNVRLRFEKENKELKNFYFSFTEKRVLCNEQIEQVDHQCVRRGLPRPLVLSLEEIPEWIFEYPCLISDYRLDERKKGADISLGNNKTLRGTIENLKELEQDYCTFLTRICLPREQVANLAKTKLIHQRFG